jgi:hypothetical protein
MFLLIVFPTTRVILGTMAQKEAMDLSGKTAQTAEPEIIETVFSLPATALAAKTEPLAAGAGAEAGAALLAQPPNSMFLGSLR